MKKTYLFLFIGLLCSNFSFGQKKKTNQSDLKNISSTISPKEVPELSAMKWRNIGPYRGGRSLAVAGHASNSLVYYFGAVGGGVWKTQDGGNNWAPISDSTFTSSSVGAITVAPSDPNVVYVGMGEADMRSNISFGDGMYKSTDAGKTWKYIGLPKADAIATIAVHPTDANIVYVAAVGNPFAPNPERGIFKSLDGGLTWKHSLAINDSTGAYHIKIDVNNPRVLYATAWQAYRNAHSMSSGGKGCGIYKSVDGGESWTSLNQKPGMPKGILGKIGIAVSPANSDRLYALIENKKGGLYTSVDAGEHWNLINDDKNLWQRPWYYMNLAADPKNELGLYVLNVNAFRTKDGGKNFQRIKVNHGDTHDIWVNPNNPENFIIGDDGGGEITFTGGEIFTELDFPTAQFYHVNLDNDIPYHIYGAQQDNSSVRIASRSTSYGITQKDWYPVAGGEAGYIVPDPLNSKITFGGEYDGQMSTYNAETDETQDISPYPESNMGHTSAEKKYRFQWTYPIVFSPHNPQKMYITSQFVHASFDHGHSWKVISGDLTRNDPKTTGQTGGPITLDQTGAEIYATVYTLAESKTEKGIIYAGSDDGLLHISKTDGDSWENITLPTSQLQDFALMSMIHSSETVKGKAYLAANRYMWGDRKPYLFKTSDYGKTWTPITNGIPEDEYCRVLRDDPNVPGLLYAGTERGIYFSINDGETWQKLNFNLPSTPIRDLQIQAREKDLVVATHGRAFWVLDDLTPLYAYAKGNLSKNSLLTPRLTYRMKGGNYRRGNPAFGENAPRSGVIVNYFLEEATKEEVKLQFLNSLNDTIITYSSTNLLSGKPPKMANDFYDDPEKENSELISSNKGLNVFLWNMKYPEATQLEGTKVPIWSGNTSGPKVPTGQYKVRFLLGNKIVEEKSFEITKDPRLSVTDEDLKEQFLLAHKVYKKLDQTHKTINEIRKIKDGISSFIKSVEDTVIQNKFKKETKIVLNELDELEQSLIQNKAKAPQDLLAFPIRLNDKLAGVKSTIESADTKPTAASYLVFQDLSSKVDAIISKLSLLKNDKLPKLNQMIEEQKIPAIQIK